MVICPLIMLLRGFESLMFDQVLMASGDVTTYTKQSKEPDMGALVEFCNSVQEERYASFLDDSRLSVSKLWNILGLDHQQSGVIGQLT